MDWLFVDWEHRPAVLAADKSAAYAMLEPGGPWVPADIGDVWTTGEAYFSNERKWRARFHDWNLAELPSAD